MRADVIERLMCDFKVDLNAMCERQKLPLTELDLRRLMLIVADGLAHCDGVVVSISPQGCNLARIVCSAFDARASRLASRHSAAM